MQYHDSHDGAEALVLVHAGFFADWFVPLAAQPAVAGLRRIRVTRTGYADPAPAGLSVADHAAECADLLRRLGTGPARILSHSSGAVYALQLALDHPDVVSGLVLSEPPLIDQLMDPADREAVGAALGPVIGRAVEAAGRGDLDTAYDTFLGLLCGPDHRAAVTAALGPEGLERAVRRSGYFFSAEVPSLFGWAFDASLAARVTVPVRLVAGGASPDFTHRLVAHLAGLLPDATTEVVPGHNHLLPLTAPAQLADVVARFTPAARPVAAN